jgi:dienelactone hydrolase
MPVPWLQIVQWVPSILELSRELLNRSRRLPPTSAGHSADPADHAARLAALEENERRQAELVSRMAEQTAQLTAAVTVLHRQTRWLVLGQCLAAGIALLAVVIAVSRGVP